MQGKQLSLKYYLVRPDNILVPGFMSARQHSVAAMAMSMLMLAWIQNFGCFFSDLQNYLDELFRQYSYLMALDAWWASVERPSVLIHTGSPHDLHN